MKNLLYKLIGIPLLSSMLWGSSAFAFSVNNQNSSVLLPQDRIKTTHSSDSIARSLGCHYEPGGSAGNVCLFLKNDIKQPGKLLFSVVRFTPINDSTSYMDSYSDYTLYNRNSRSGGTESILQFTHSPDGYQVVDLSTLPCGVNEIEAKLQSGETTGEVVYEKKC